MLNLVYVHAHDAGRFIQPHGLAVNTPHLQKLAEQGIMFRQAFCAGPSCSPSRAALLTGRHPHEVGMHGLASPKWGYQIENPDQHLARVLARHGYETALAGIQHVLPLRSGAAHARVYQQYLDEDDVLGEENPATIDRAVRFIGWPHDQPFFLSVGINEPHRVNNLEGIEDGLRHTKHRAYDVDAVDSRYVSPPPGFPDLPQLRRDWAQFRIGIEEFDRKVGRIVAAVDAAGLAEDTLIIATSDHGIEWPGGKCNLTELGLGVFLILRGPTALNLTGGRVVDAMVSHLDLLPTLCDLLSMDPPHELRGKSLMPLVRGEAASLHEHLFAEQGWHEVAEPMRSIRDQRYRYVRHFAQAQHGPRLENCDPGPARDLFSALGYFATGRPGEQLFDVLLDPQQRRDLAGDPAHAEVLADLRRRLEAWMDATDDPLRCGAAVRPPAYSDDTAND